MVRIMKKALKLIAIFLSMICLFISLVSAETQEENIITCDNVTFMFEFDSHFTNDEKQKIVAVIMNENSDDTYEDTKNIICSLLGHSFTTESVSRITHKVHTYAPRCLMDVYDVSTCSRCGHTEKTLANSIYIYCCPED